VRPGEDVLGKPQRRDLQHLARRLHRYARRGGLGASGEGSGRPAGMTEIALETEPILRTSPYQGLTHFGKADEPYFFGREREREVLVAKLIVSRLTVVYGPSGVGKSSLLDAG